MLTHDQIKSAINYVALLYPIKKVSYFGSYAENKQTPSSDLDLLVEFTKPAVSLFMIADIKKEIEDRLKISVDVIHAPISKNALIKVGKEVRLYG